MSGTYRATGINLKAMPIGENDRLMTILTPEHGLIKAIVPGARKSKSSLGGRSALFMVNDLLIFKGRSLDKVTQAQTLISYGKLIEDLGKLAASQYLAEIVLAQALSDRPQAELYQLLLLHLGRIDNLDRGDNTGSIAHLCQGIFHLLALDGIAPQVHSCCITRQPIEPNFTMLDWQIGFSIESGSTVELGVATEDPSIVVNYRLKALDLLCFQHLSDPNLHRLELAIDNFSLETITDTELAGVWRRLERILRQHIHYHLNIQIRSAALIDL
ncbi:DNA repair protein RecO [Chamaesiphon sp.]|uniref:DNA repair protein RecO n=1 Tax=Chamaesiphon sp. TaxID=2814140 RepID=UPI00359350BB